MPAKFQIYRDHSEKFRFRLRAENNEIIVTGEAYEQHAGCIKGIKSVQKNCASEIEDMTTDKRIPNPKYQVFTDEKGEFRFHLNASNGEIVAQSESYKTKEGCLNGIEAVKSSCNAEIEDLTIAEKPNEKATKSEPAPAASIAEKKMPPSTRASEKTVFVGNKTPMDYVLAIITGLSTGNINELTLKARGQSITTAVDAAEITRNRFLKGLKVSKIAIGTEEMPPRQGETKPRNVSTIEIVLTKE